MKEMLKERMHYKARILMIFALVIGSVLANLALPMYLSDVINMAIPQKDMGAVFASGAKMLFFVVIGISCSIAMGYFAAHVSVGIGRTLRAKVFRKVQSFSQIEFDQISTSSLITRTNNDVVQVQTFINILLRISLMAPIMAVGGIVMALAKSVTMSMILLLAMPVLLIFIFTTARKIMPLSTQMQERLDEINLVIREKLTGIRVARTFGTELYEEERFEKVNRSFMENSIRLGNIMATMMPGLNLVLSGTTIALLAFGGDRIIKGASLPIGDVIAVVQYVVQIMISVLMLSMVFLVYPRAAVSAKRINEVLNTDPKIQDPKIAIAPNSKGHITFRDVSFTFSNAKAPALQGLSFESKPGEVTAIIGSTGCGKSTLVNLIPRFYDVDRGEILIDGVNVKDMELNFLRNKIGIVPQKAFLFKGTIAENVGYGNGELSEEELKDALRIAQSLDFVMEKEGGLSAPVTQGATNLSGGQKQRLAIARAIARKPEIYIFDDSFSALDFKTDAALRKALLEEAKDATVILVAQRVSTIKNADRIIVLEDGQMVGFGKHDELLRDCEVYREIVYSQLSREEAQ
ncbi:MAG: ABC transporter ATP-binding protein [Peptostreptococcaceae bacterium]|nr:ABC transporter ATP-binding protein [Peptostreptococcaceae bacterium]